MTIEADIVWSLKRHLQQNGLGQDRWSVSDIAVDSDGSFRGSKHAADLEPMLSMPIQGFYPDLVCAYRHPTEEGLAAFEVKGHFEDWVKGITQARAYRSGVHRSYLAIPEGKGARINMLERDAGASGVGVWLLRKSGWAEIVRAENPRPTLSDCRSLSTALRGIVLPRRLQLNHPINYLASVWVLARNPEEPLIQAMEKHWSSLNTLGVRRHAINGARYLGLITNDDRFTRLGMTVRDLLNSLGFENESKGSRRRRFADASPGLAAVTRLVLMQQESCKLIVEALEKADNREMNTEELLREAAKINTPLATGQFLTNPRDFDLERIPSSSFSPSFTFQFKQILWHAGILANPIHNSTGKGASEYRHEKDIWKLDERFARRSIPQMEPAS